MTEQCRPGLKKISSLLSSPILNSVLRSMEIAGPASGKSFYVITHLERGTERTSVRGISTDTHTEIFLASVDSLTSGWTMSGSQTACVPSLIAKLPTICQVNIMRLLITTGMIVLEETNEPDE